MGSLHNPSDVDAGAVLASVNEHIHELGDQLSALAKVSPLSATALILAAIEAMGESGKQLVLAAVVRYGPRGELAARALLTAGLNLRQIVVADAQHEQARAAESAAGKKPS